MGLEARETGRGGLIAQALLALSPGALVRQDRKPLPQR